MVKRVKNDWEQQMMKSRWMVLILAVVFLAAAYGFASLAIDSGSLWEYALAILFVIWAAKEIKREIHNLRK